MAVTLSPMRVPANPALTLPSAGANATPLQAATGGSLAAPGAAPKVPTAITAPPPVAPAVHSPLTATAPVAPNAAAQATAATQQANATNHAQDQAATAGQVLQPGANGQPLVGSTARGINGINPITGEFDRRTLEANAAAYGVGGQYAGELPFANGQSSVFGNLSNDEMLAKQQQDFGLGAANNGQTQGMLAQAQNTGQYYSGAYNDLGTQAGLSSATAANRGTQMYGGDTLAYQGALNQAGTDQGMQTGAYAALNNFAANTPASAARTELGNANASYGNLNNFASNLTANAGASDLASAANSVGNLNGFAANPFSMAGQSQLNQAGQTAGQLDQFGNSIGTGPSAAAGNLATAAAGGKSLSQFGSSALGGSAGASQLAGTQGAVNGLNQFAGAGTGTAAQQQFDQANNAYALLNQFQAQPQGASAAEQQLRQSTDANTLNMLAMARSGSGMGGDATALKQALNANATTQQQANSQAAQLRANEYTAYMGQKLQAQTAQGSLANSMANTRVTENDARLGQQLQAMQSSGELNNSAAGLRINEDLQKQQQRTAALQASSDIANASGGLQISEQNSNQQNRINALNAAGGMQNQAASTANSAQAAYQANQLQALQSAGTLANQSAGLKINQQQTLQADQLAAMGQAGQLANTTAGLQINQQQGNQANQLAALNAAGQLGTSTVNSDIARATSGLAGAQYQTNTALQGTQLNDATSQAWSAQQQAAIQQALAAEVGAQTQGLNINNAALAGRESEWAGANSRAATAAGLASNQAIASAQQNQAYTAAGLSAAGTIGAAGLTALSDETEKDVIKPLGMTNTKVGAGPSLGAPVGAGAVPTPTPSPPKPPVTTTQNPGGPSLADKQAATDTRHAAMGGAVGGAVGQVGGSVAGSAIAGPLGGIVGGLIGKVGGGLIGKLIGSDVRGKTNIQPLSGKPSGALGALHELASSMGAGGVASSSKDVQKYATAKPMVMPPMNVSGNQSLARLTSPGMRGVGPTGNPGDQFVADSARNAPGSLYQYKDPNAPGAAPGMQAGPMAQDLARHPVTAPAVGKDPATGKLYVDGPRLALANTAQNHSQQNQLDSLDKKTDALASMLSGSSGPQTPYPDVGQIPDYGLDSSAVWPRRKGSQY